MTQPNPPGWYPDPSGAGGTRYWDGNQWGPTAPQPVKKRKVWPWIVLAVVVLFFGGCAAIVGVVGSSISSNTSSSSAGKGDSATAGVGQEVRDGKFAFTVTNVRTAPDAGTSKARGEFVIVTMTVTNIGNQPQSFFVQNQKLFDSGGREFAADSMAALGINGDENGDNTSMLTDMNPGFKVTVQVPFDVPPGTKPATLELHDSAFSGGVKVKL